MPFLALLENYSLVVHLVATGSSHQVKLLRSNWVKYQINSCCNYKKISSVNGHEDAQKKKNLRKLRNESYFPFMSAGLIKFGCRFYDRLKVVHKFLSSRAASEDKLPNRLSIDYWWNRTICLFEWIWITVTETLQLEASGAKNKSLLGVSLLFSSV